MIDREEQPAADLAGEGHDAVVGGDDHRADGGRDVDPAVSGAIGIVRRVEATDDRSCDGPRPRNRRARTEGRPPHHRDHNEDRTQPSHDGDATADVRTDP